MQPIVKLSGGQKARVVFVSIALSYPHILLLDEPTNHLDMQSIDALCEEVTSFGGGIVVISHDSTLLDALCEDTDRSEVWIVEDGKVKKWHSDFAEYKEALIQEIRDELDADDRTFGRGAYALPVATT
jgi:ATP-binding cassette, subfamily F, member 1